MWLVTHSVESESWQINGDTGMMHGADGIKI